MGVRSLPDNRPGRTNNHPSNKQKNQSQRKDRYQGGHLPDSSHARSSKAKPGSIRNPPQTAIGPTRSPAPGQTAGSPERTRWRSFQSLPMRVAQFPGPREAGGAALTRWQTASGGDRFIRRRTLCSRALGCGVLCPRLASLSLAAIPDLGWNGHDDSHPSWTGDQAPDIESVGAAV